MQEEIGNTAGIVWAVLKEKGEMSLGQLRKQVKVSPPVLEWALGWLARENNVVITPFRNSYRVSLR